MLVEPDLTQKGKNALILIRRNSRLSIHDLNEIEDILTPDVKKMYESNSFQDLVPRSSKVSQPVVLPTQDENGRRRNDFSPSLSLNQKTTQNLSQNSSVKNTLSVKMEENSLKLASPLDSNVFSLKSSTQDKQKEDNGNQSTREEIFINKKKRIQIISSKMITEVKGKSA